jgi:RNA polymerase sigma-70 factor (ECF subfamily)
MTEQEFNELFRAQQAELTRFTTRRAPVEDVEDLLSDLFALAWQKRDLIPRGLELPWLYKSARFLISNHNRKQAGRRSILESLREPECAPSAESIALADVSLAAAWKRIAPREQEIISLWAFEGLDVAEIATVLGRSKNAIAIALSRAKSRLAQELEIENN